jgi:predicted anti-sigma-YlaC factor YlaD
MRLTCKEASRLVSRGLDQRLPLHRRMALRLHLAICTGCANFSKQMAFLRRALRELAEKSS